MKRALSLLLCIALVMGLLPVTAFAAEDAPETAPVTVSEDTPAEVPEDTTAEDAPDTAPAEEAPEDTPAAVSEDVPAPIANPGYSDATTANTWIEITWGTEENALSHWKCSGGQIVADESDSLPQTVTYDNSTHTLTLDNATLNTIEIINWGSTALTIVVKGTNTVKPVNKDEHGNGMDGIYIANCHNVTIKGEGSNAKLTVETSIGEGQFYGTPLRLSDGYISDSENPGEDEFHSYPDGSLTIEGVELVLTNNETGIENAEQGHASAFNALGNVTLKNGAKITAKGLQGIDAKGNFTIGEGCTVETDALNISGFDGYDEGNGNVRKLTVNGTLKITGAMNGATGTEEELNWWWPSLWIRPSAQLVLNANGAVTVHSTYVEGEAISLDHADWNDETTPDYLIPAEAHINGGTLTVEDVKAESAGIVLNAGTKWVQTAGDVTVKTATGVGSGSCGIAISGDADAKSAGYDIGPASFEQSGGTVNVDFSNVNIPDDEDHHGVVCVTNSGNLTLSGSAKFNVTISGTDNHWSQGVQTRKDTVTENKVETILDQTEPTMTVKDSAELTVDLSGLTGTGEDAGFLGLNVENSTFNIAGGTVTVKLPGAGKTANGVNGIQVSSSKLNISGGKVDITENGGTLGELRGLILGKYNWEDENSPASELNMSGGSVNISLKPTMQDDVNLCGISNWDDGIASITGGTVTIDVTGALSSDQQHYNNLIYGIESTGESLTIQSGAKVDFTGGFTGTYSYTRTGDDDPEGWISFHGIDIRERSTYTQSGDVTIKLADGNVPEDDSYGINAENRSTVIINGNLTIGHGISSGIYIDGYTKLEIGNGANIVFNTNGFARGISAYNYSDVLITEGSHIDFDMNTDVSDGISAWTYSNITITGGTIDIDLPMLPHTESGFWFAGAFWLVDHSALSVSGNTTININQSTGRTVPEEEFSSYGIIMLDDGYMRVSGGTMNIKAAVPVYWESMIQPYSGHISLADGIRAVYTDGENKGHEVTVFNETMHVDADPEHGIQDPYDYDVYAYLSGPEAYPDTAEEFELNRDNEFGVKIAKQTAEPAAPVKQEYSGLLELVNPGMITAGQSVTLRMTATLPDGTDELTISVDNGTIERGSVSINGAAPTSANNVTYSSDGKSVTLTINSGDIVRFNVIPGNGKNTVTATVTTTNGTHAQAVEFTAEALTLELPTATNTPTITVSGVTAAGKEVTVYVNGAAQTTKVTANQAGVWSTTVTFSAPGTYQVQAKTATSSSDVKTVVYNQVVPTVKSLTVTNWVHGRTSADPAEKVESKITYDVNGKITAPKYYIYWPELTRFVFTVEVESGTNIEEMWVNCTDWKGDKETVYLKDDDGDGVWEGEGYFCGLDPDGNEHIVPEHFMVVYVVDLPGGRQTFCTSDSNRPSSCGDPSGFVYEGLETNRLAGVTTTIYHKESSSVAGDGTEWDATAYDQENPLTTDELGQYLWMVPAGLWRVKYEVTADNATAYGYTATDYQAQYSAWMEVPPVRTGVNQNLTSNAAATATVEFDTELNEYVIRFNRPVQVSDVMQNLNVTVEDFDNVEFRNLVPADAGWADTGSNGPASTLCATTFTTDIVAYGENGELIAIPAGKTISVSCEAETIKTYMDTGSTVNETLQAPERTYHVTVEHGSGSGDYEPGVTVTVSADVISGSEFVGWYIESEVTPEGFEPESSSTSFEMPACDVTLVAWYNEVEKPAESGGSSSGGIFRPNRPTRPGVLSPSDTGVSMTLDVSGSVAFIQGFPDGTVCPDKTLTRAEAVQMIYRLVSNKPATAANPFKDVKDGDWFSEAALGLAAMGVIKGKGAADTFAPGDTMTRAEFAAVCARLAVETEAPTTFADVPANHWAAKEISTAAAYGWINGRDGTHFDPNTGITRAEAAKIINCMIGRAPVTDGSDVTFTDLSPEHWAYGEILAAAQGK